MCLVWLTCVRMHRFFPPSFFFPSTWKKWLTTAKVFAQRGPQRYSSVCVSQSGESNTVSNTFSCCCPNGLAAIAAKQIPHPDPKYTLQRRLCKSKWIVWRWSVKKKKEEEEERPQKSLKTFFNPKMNYFHMLHQMVEQLASAWNRKARQTVTWSQESFEGLDEKRKHPYLITGVPSMTLFGSMD